MPSVSVRVRPSTGRILVHDETRPSDRHKPRETTHLVSCEAELLDRAGLDRLGAFGRQVCAMYAQRYEYLARNRTRPAQGDGDRVLYSQ